MGFRDSPAFGGDCGGDGSCSKIGASGNSGWGCLGNAVVAMEGTSGVSDGRGGDNHDVMVVKATMMLVAEMLAAAVLMGCY
ncbi:hypothetical protein C1H46_001205 [Malus baccata]|uniref:Uncharacterized protein n=1 Tax=Malus baccata TaxID=106549 RepID=A0A540NQ18_MALBA|nr:hypothetical protein C1H46_001205 [Malus baccata]